MPHILSWQPEHHNEGEHRQDNKEQDEVALFVR